MSFFIIGDCLQYNRYNVNLPFPRQKFLAQNVPLQTIARQVWKGAHLETKIVQGSRKIVLRLDGTRLLEIVDQVCLLVDHG